MVLGAACLLLLPTGAAGAGTGSISGTLTAQGGGPLEGIHVCAPPEFGSKCADTDSGGNYTIEGLAEGSYVVRFAGGDDYASEYYDDVASQRDATPVQVLAEATTGEIDAELAPAARIEGEVTDAATEAPLQGVLVCPNIPYGSGHPLGSCATTGAGGAYSIGGLTAGSYRVSFSGAGLSPRYLTQYFDGKSVAGEGLVLDLAAGETETGIDAAMEMGGILSGVVTAEAGGAALQGVHVCASSPKFESGWPTCAPTDADGEYAISGLSTGSYKMKFSPGGPGLNYLGQYYSGAATKQAATQVSVTAGATTGGIDAALRTAGRIAGTVTDAGSGEPVAYQYVCARQVGDPEWEAGGLMCDYTDAEGEYAIEGLPAASYYVRFSPGYSSPGYLRQYYDGKGSRAEATPVQVIAGSTAGGVDAAMEEGGRIVGTVTDAFSHEPAHPIQACAFAVGGSGEEEHCDVTDVTGAYEIRGLASGSYRVRFSPSAGYNPEPDPIDYAYATQYYDGKGSEGEADAVTVTAPATTADIDAAMEEGGRIEGTVIGFDGAEPLDEVQACAFSVAAGEYERCDSTGKSGEYTIEGLSPGEYEVSFQAFSFPEEQTNFLRRYYDEADSPAGATPVSVSTGATQSGIDAALRAGGQIAGKVTDAASGAPLQSIDACALEASGDEELVLCESTDVNGEYTLSSLPTGSYKVEFAKGYPDLEGGIEAVFATQFFPAKPSAAQADPVAVTADSLTGSIDAQMAEPDEGGAVEGEGERGSGGEGDTAPSPDPPAAAPPSPPAVGTKHPKPPTAGPKRGRCPEGKVKQRRHGKVRCVKKKHGHRHRRGHRKHRRRHHRHGRR